MDLLPPAVSTYAADIDRMFWIILAVTGIVFIAVEVTLVVFLIKYRGREGRKAYYIEGNAKAEIIWTTIPAVIVIVLAIMSQSAWSRIKNPDRFPADALELNIEAKQFEWNITYPGPDGVLDTDDDFSLRNQLHIPVNRPVIVHLSAIDVIHSFFIPVFRIKQDVVPGRTIAVWFEAMETGEFEIACAELCGLGHYRMRARLIIHPQEEYASWMRDRAAD